MKQFLLSLLCLMCVAFVQAQNTFSDDIESYTDGAYIGASSPNWTVWSGAAGEGTAEDATVSTEAAHSGKQSIRLEAGSASSGPTDLVLPFGGEKNIGTFTYTMWVYVTADNSAYWNFQGKATIGSIWAVDNYVTSDGHFFATLGSASTGSICNVDFAHEAWNKYTLVANMTRNEWEIKINDVSVVKFANPNNSIASIDIFPLYGGDVGGSSAIYYIDDVSYTYEPYTLRALDGGLISINMKNRFLANEASGGSVQIRNLGTTAINSVNLSCQVGSGAPVTASVSNVNVASLAFLTIPVSPITYAAGASDLKCTITSVNGAADNDPTNDDKLLSLYGVTPAPHKVMFTEEATGTWCQWCPRGAVYLDSMARTYPKYWAGVAVHNNDPMTVAVYDNWLRTFPGFSGYPSIINDRNQLTDPLTVEADFYDHIVVPTPVILTNGAKYDSTKRELEVSVKGDFIDDISGDYRFNLVVIENNIQFPGTGYRQSNAYAGNSRGWMGGFEKLPHPVPANRIRYNHVARAIFDNAVGLEGYLPSTIKKGSTYYITYTMTLADSFKAPNIELIGLLYGPGGEVVNATITTLDEAIRNGLYSSTSNPSLVFSAPKLAPNPSDAQTNIELNLQQDAQVGIDVVDLTGKTITSRNYGKLSGDVILPINTEEFDNGSYIIKLRINEKMTTRKLIVNHR